ncbi:MAG: GNAT family N-acetyltransferase [Gemmatimonadetes bacterium]|nr:GNAT family N-acetyltransferase [Gemmatimonadota bacterium]MCA9762200.1 GNAT family N-acetyltransferase [Gemmatimonadota bacterium]HPF62354.1 GNAT family N-acetyltransferase [Gemmatimonadales bacterium]
MTIHTARLALIPATADHLRAELTGPDALAAALGVEVPAAWPPPLYDGDAVRWVLDRIAEDARHLAWGTRYFIWKAPDGHVAVGAGGFRGPPDRAGTVEIGYSILPAYQRRGFASEATEGMVQHAFTDTAVTRVIAETLPDLTPSIGVLEKQGFSCIGEGSEPGVIRFERRR